jgi:adenylate cyclase
VAAPIRVHQGEVIGALYGDRRGDRMSRTKPLLSRAEAMLVELIASGVASGLYRIEQEKAVLESQAKFAQFFTPELSRQLAAHPDLLNGRDCEVTLLFCDIRGFSRISERLGAARTANWIGEFLQALSESVRAQRGVLVDYIGDELIAMWGAPEDQPDHAQLACQAALDMMAALVKLNEHWEPTLGEPLRVGIGINTGIVWVGNTGSKFKFKYGPLGNTVNLASRVEGATRHLKTTMLITGATKARLDDSFECRRLGRIRVVNIAEPVDIYELTTPGQPNYSGLRVGYERALEAFETKDFRTAVRILGNLVNQFPADGPSLLLIARATNALAEENTAEFDPVWKLDKK